MTARDTSREARIVALYQQGWTLQAIGEEYGVTRERVRQLLAQAGQVRRRTGRRGPSLDYAAICRLYVTGIGVAAIGEQMGCTPPAIYRALRANNVPLRRPQLPNHHAAIAPSDAENVAAYPHQRRDVGRPVSN